MAKKLHWMRSWAPRPMAAGSIEPQKQVPLTGGTDSPR